MFEGVDGLVGGQSVVNGIPGQLTAVEERFDVFSSAGKNRFQEQGQQTEGLKRNGADCVQFCGSLGLFG